MGLGRRQVGTAARRLVLEIVGWTLVLAGIAALVLPGPGLLLMVAGLAVLSRQYDWAERRLEPVRAAALRTAAEGVSSWWRILGSVLAALTLAAVGVVWGLRPPAPDWWPLRDSWWLAGGWTAGVTMIFSALLALTLLAWSYRNHR